MTARRAQHAAERHAGHGYLEFDRPVPPSGYAWWYVDALSDDERHGLTLIVMIGSVFSPYYAQARRGGPTNPEEHSALNVALYGAVDGLGRAFGQCPALAARAI